MTCEVPEGNFFKLIRLIPINRRRAPLMAILANGKKGHAALHVMLVKKGAVLIRVKAALSKLCPPAIITSLVNQTVRLREPAYSTQLVNQVAEFVNENNTKSNDIKSRMIECSAV